MSDGRSQSLRHQYGAVLLSKLGELRGTKIREGLQWGGSRLEGPGDGSPTT